MTSRQLHRGKEDWIGGDTLWFYGWLIFSTSSCNFPLFGGWVPMASVGTSTGEQKVFVEMSSRNEHGKGFRSQEPGCLVSHVMCEPPAPHVYKQRLREMIHRPIIEGKDREKGEKLI